MVGRGKGPITAEGFPGGPSGDGEGVASTKHTGGIEAGLREEKHGGLRELLVQWE